MQRRDFLKILLTTPLAEFVDYEKLLWIPKTQIVVPSLWRPTAAQQKFLDTDDKFIFFFGIPYHSQPNPIGTWLGIERSKTPQFSAKIHPSGRSLIDAIKELRKMEKNK
jgi:hypothetical protein